MKVINFCGSAGAGKSTAAMGLAYAMKQRYVEVELIDEYAKRLILAGSQHMLADQLSVLAEQNSRIFYANSPHNKIQYVITDSPLFLSAFYTPSDYPDSFTPFVFDMFSRYDNVNIFLERNHPYNQAGRLQTEAESDADSQRMKDMLTERGIAFTTMKAGDHVPMAVMEMLGVNLPPAKPVTPPPVGFWSRILGR